MSAGTISLFSGHQCRLRASHRASDPKAQRSQGRRAAACPLVTTCRAALQRQSVASSSPATSGTSSSKANQGLRCRQRPWTATRHKSASTSEAAEEYITENAEDANDVERAGLPFTVPEEFLEDCETFLIEQEGLDPEDPDLQYHVMSMARQMCEAAENCDSDEDDDILLEIHSALSDVVKQQDAWEKSYEDQGLEPPIPSFEDAGWSYGPAKLPDGVNADSLVTIMEWQNEAIATRGGQFGSLGYSEGDGLAPAAATLTMGVNGWRIGSKMNEVIQVLASNIEAFWRQLFPDDLMGTTMDPRWKMVDSVAYNNPGLEWGKKDPAAGDKEYPRMVLENRCYQTREFRNLHLEMVLRQDGLQVLHCVMWPRLQYDIPIFGLDVVVSPSGSVQYVIADTSPVTADKSLPSIYSDAVKTLKEQFTNSFASKKLPEWGQDIFSSEVVAARPDGPLDTDMFVMYAAALARVNLLYAKRCQPLGPENANELVAIESAHRRYCETQRGNVKTRAVLRKSFEHLGTSGDLFVERYLREVLFDHEFHYEITNDVKDVLKRDNFKDGQAHVDNSQANEALQTVVTAMKKQAQEETGDKPSSDDKPGSL